MADTGVRSTMTEYWEEHATAGSVQEMMLDDNAHTFADQERSEILAMLPDTKNKTVLELGAGIGRFTSELAKTAKSVIAVDFMENFTKKNREANGHMSNIKFLCADVMKMEIPEKSVDILFSNWLFMYLSDQEITRLVPKMLSWLKDDGHFFYRESCFHQSGTKLRSANPTEYRSPTQYNSLMLAPTLTVQEENKPGKCFCFELINCTSVKTYIEVKGNSNQIVWLLKKVVLDPTHDGFRFVQQKLDKHKYSQESLARYQTIYGQGFICSGGIQTTQELTSHLNLQKGQRILDIGCCPGGSAHYLAKRYGVDYLGLHESSNVISLAMQKAHAWHEHSVQFELCNELTFETDEKSFDAVYSRDHFMHFKDKEIVFDKIYKWLKPGGKLVVTDYCCADNQQKSTSFQKYVTQRGYFVISVEAYKKIVAKFGFENVSVQDKTNDFIRILRQELNIFENKKEAVIQRFGKVGYQTIADGWRSKIDRCERGMQSWVVIVAQKPT